MYSVTSRIKAVKQPWGGYVKPSSFDKIPMNDGKKLNPIENIHASLIGMVVDYLTRFSMGSSVEEAFNISLMGANLKTREWDHNANTEAKNYLNNIKDLSDKSIISACKITTFDAWYRDSYTAILAKTAKDINPDEATIENIRTMVNRSILFFKKYGPVTVDGFTFEPNGYSKTVCSGDGDFLTKDTLWDFKVPKNNPTSKHTLQLLMYWIMGQHSGKPEYKNITKIGIFNPRLNIVYLLDVTKIPASIIKEVEENVICY